MRDDILKYLRSVASSTAKAISESIRAERLDVAKELNALHSEGFVEREKRKGDEYTYWLTLVDSEPAAPQLSAQKPEATTADLQGESVLDVKLRELRAAKAEIERLNEALKGAAVIADRAGTEIKRLKSENAALEQAAEDWKRNCTQLGRRIDELTVGPVGGKPLFVTVGRHCKPQRHDSLDAAQKRAGKLIRAEKESAILICEPLGQVIRGAQWMPRAASNNDRGAQ